MSGCGEVSDFGAGQAHRREVIGLRAREPSPRTKVGGLAGVNGGMSRKGIPE